jgi:hypothetical protein
MAMMPTSRAVGSLVVCHVHWTDFVLGVPPKKAEYRSQAYAYDTALFSSRSEITLSTSSSLSVTSRSCASLQSRWISIG